MGSFSATVKAELCRTEVGKSCCAMAEALGVLLFSNTFSPELIRIVTESTDFSERLPRLFRKAFGLQFDALTETKQGGKSVCQITDLQKIARVFELCGFSARTSVVLHVNFAVLESDCCRKAFLRGAFLAGGSVTDPHKQYQLELSTTHQRVSGETQTLMGEMELLPKETQRKGSHVLYFKQSESIEDFLTSIGAPISAMAVMQAKIEKDWRNEANRKTNCDTANVMKTVDAAQMQLSALRKLETSGVLHSLPEKLRQTALLRFDNPESNLAELAALHDPPASKSAVNHRMRKLIALSEEE
ncbi:MAG: DNA-binding protein WhiA [Oscillospiraceae bacterium]|jgi:DNA-binding protein WhiA|nr:DNA-binding protein WhiA [Oscillospiraceae bacterium]